MSSLWEKMHPNAHSKNGVMSRVAGAVARPWLTSYVCPVLMTLSAVVYALRGYEPYWTEVRPPDDEGLRPSSLYWRVYRNGWPSHGVEVRCVFPRWMVHAECWLRNRLRGVR